MITNNYSWRMFRSLFGATLLAGNAPGIYAIGRVDRRYGLPLMAEWAYVGRTNSLRRRLLQHRSAIEANPGLWNWLRRNRDGLEIWLVSIDPITARQMEKDLIRAVNPLYNRIRYEERK